jgi:hypothetical protein
MLICAGRTLEVIAPKRGASPYGGGVTPVEPSARPGASATRPCYAPERRGAVVVDG